MNTRGQTKRNVVIMSICGIYAMITGIWVLAIIFLLLDVWYIIRLIEKKDPKEARYIVTTKRIYNELVYDNPDGKPKVETEEGEEVVKSFDMAKRKDRKAYKQYQAEQHQQRLKEINDEFDFDFDAYLEKDDNSEDGK
jgi:hypothetical protein